MIDLFNILDYETVAECADIPKIITDLIGSVIDIIKIGVPIILVVLGMLDLGKAVTSQKEEEIKKAQSILIKRLIYGVLIFLVVAIVQFVIGILDAESSEAIGCLKAIFR